MYTEVVYLDDDPLEETIEKVEEEAEEEQVEEFYCSTCDINISNVEEHIQEYHFGENIVVEVCVHISSFFRLLSDKIHISGSTITKATRIRQIGTTGYKR